MIVLRIRLEFEESFTELSINGEHEENLANVITSTYLNSSAEVFRLDDDGEWMAAEDFEHG